MAELQLVTKLKTFQYDNAMEYRSLTIFYKLEVLFTGSHALTSISRMELLKGSIGMR